ncbi:alpha/beta hydrolase [Psychromonas sp. GE-S-Ul-11]|uniref:alpha/beta hydrolase n=1 Tax=Psychromonas sp. GE-S-Ul-11 TaxID=3241170 RepID=UPI00390C5470
MLNNKQKIIAATLIFAIISLTTGCVVFNSKPSVSLDQSEQYYPYIQPTFNQYLAETKTWLMAHRQFINADHTEELAMNMPFQLFPEQATDKAILLVHGLGDSPYSFSDLAVTLQSQGFYVQTLLLPGHGSKADDLKLATYADWQQIVDHYVELLKQDYKQVWLGGFSTGANLVTVNAIDHGGIAGLLLFSPGFESHMPILERLTPLLATVFDGWEGIEDNYVKYNSAPTLAGAAYADSAVVTRDKIDHNNITIPTLVVVSEADSVINSEATEERFHDSFTNPKNQLIWYGDKQQATDNVSVFPMHLDQYKISTASHMSPIFAPDNPYYGQYGEKIICENSFDNQAIEACKSGAEVWFSAWGYSQADRIYARLTWNPYYKELTESIKQITDSITP